MARSQDIKQWIGTEDGGDVSRDGFIQADETTIGGSKTKRIFIRVHHHQSFKGLKDHQNQVVIEIEPDEALDLAGRLIDSARRTLLSRKDQS